MPLKIDDLKTVENYKKAIKQDLSKISTQGNTKFWIYKDIELPTASGGKNKFPALLAFVDDTATKAVLKGKQPLCRGTCGLQGNKIAFEATQGKVPYKVLTITLPMLLGKMVHIPTGADAESDGEEAPLKVGTAPAPPVPPAGAPAPGRYAQLNATWKQLSQQADERVKANPGEYGRVAQMKAGIPEMLQGGQLAEAEKRIDALAAMLAPKAAAPPEAAAVTTRWNTLIKRVEAAEAAHPEKKADIVRARAGIPDMIKAGKLELAAKLMDTVEQVLAQASAPGARPSAAASARQSTGEPYVGIVKYRKSLLEFAQAKNTVRGQIRGLQSAIASSLPQAADFARDLAHELEELNQELADVVDEAMKAAENEASPATDAIKLKIRKYMTELASNRLIQQAETNPFGAAVTIRKTLGSALGRIRDAMPA